MIFDAFGNLFGTTSAGGAYYGGTVFELSPANGTWTETLLHEFGNGADGSNPTASLVWDSAGNLYGTTTIGGDNSFGTVFEMTPAEGGTWNETVLHSFEYGTADGQTPGSALVLNKSGNLYGTTVEGGISSDGVVFELTQSNGAWSETIPHFFNYSDKDGLTPRAGLTLDSAGNLYGTTSWGGAYSYHGGIVFRLRPDAEGGWLYGILHSFGDSQDDGAEPYAGLILDGGNLYGTTLQGGAYGSGTVFEIKP